MSLKCRGAVNRCRLLLQNSLDLTPVVMFAVFFFYLVSCYMPKQNDFNTQANLGLPKYLK